MQTTRTWLAVVTVWAAGCLAAAAVGADEWEARIEAPLANLIGNERRVATVLEGDSANPSGQDVVSRHVQGLDAGVASLVTVERVGEGWGLSLTLFYDDSPDGNLFLHPLASQGAGKRTVLRLDEVGRSWEAPVAGDGELNLHAETHLYRRSASLGLTRVLRSSPRGRTVLTLGVRAAWYWDNLYVNVFQSGQGAFGHELEATAESDVMIGPEASIAWRRTLGRHALDLAATQAVVFGDVELDGSLRRIGPVEATTGYAITHGAVVPMTELRCGWTFRLSRHLGVGVGGRAALWWEMPQALAEPEPDGSTPVEKVAALSLGIGLSAAWRW